jgi:hypothetical protein
MDVYLNHNQMRKRLRIIEGERDRKRDRKERER